MEREVGRERSRERQVERGRERETERERERASDLFDVKANEDVDARLALHPPPYNLHTLHPTPYNLHPTTCTLHPAPYNLHPTPTTLNPPPHTHHPPPTTLHPPPYSIHPTPSVLGRTCSTSKPMKTSMQVSARNCGALGALSWICGCRRCGCYIPVWENLNWYGRRTGMMINVLVWDNSCCE